jgi:hypothetical protein
MLAVVLLTLWPVALPALGGTAEREADRGAAPLALVVPTFFASTDEPRFQLTVKTLREAVHARVPVVVIDASPEPIRQQLGATGARVVAQERPGKKGVALREGIALALQLEGPTEGRVIGFFEPEKLGMVRWMREAAAYLRANRLDVVIPSREQTLFKSSYPREQYHQEMFANLLIDSIATARGFPPGIDWTFGPVLFDARLAPAWLGYAGALWDAQVIPYVRAVKFNGATIGSFEVPYTHPAQMKREEEGKARWARKRYDQLALWAKVLPNELAATVDPDGGRVQLPARGGG